MQRLFCILNLFQDDFNIIVSFYLWYYYFEQISRLGACHGVLTIVSDMVTDFASATYSSIIHHLIYSSGAWILFELVAWAGSIP